MSAEVTVHKVTLDLDAFGRHGVVEVGGTDVANLVRGFTLTSKVNHLTQLTLDLVVTKGAKVDAGALVSVGAETAALLVELGWTPPTNEVAAELDGDIGTEWRSVVFCRNRPGRVCPKGLQPCDPCEINGDPQA